MPPVPGQWPYLLDNARHIFRDVTQALGQWPGQDLAEGSAVPALLPGLLQQRSPAVQGRQEGRLLPGGRGAIRRVRSEALGPAVAILATRTYRKLWCSRLLPPRRPPRPEKRSASLSRPREYSSSTSARRRMNSASSCSSSRRNSPCSSRQRNCSLSCQRISVGKPWLRPGH